MLWSSPRVCKLDPSAETKLWSNCLWKSEEIVQSETCPGTWFPNLDSSAISVITVHKFGSFCLRKGSAHQQPWRNQPGVKVIALRAVWEPGGNRLSEGLSQVGCKISRADVLRAVISLPSLAPAEWDTVVTWSLRSLLTRKRQSLVLFLRVFCAPGQTGGLSPNWSWIFVFSC